MEFLAVCAVVLAVGFVGNVVQNWIDHRRYMAAHAALREARLSQPQHPAGRSHGHRLP